MESENSNRREFLRSAANAFLNLFEPKLCAENGEFFKSLQNLYPSEYYKQIVEIITRYESCEICRVRTRKLSCSHTFCQTHAENLCRTCKAPVKSEDTNQLFCQTCYKIKPKSQFNDGTCMHQCSNCINLILGQDFVCKICMNRYEANVKTNKSECNNCTIPKIKCHMLYLDCKHLVCASCLRYTIQERKCSICTTSYLQDKQVMAIRTYLESQKCHSCNNDFSDDLSYCISCNLNYCTKCANIHLSCKKVEYPLYS